MPSTYTTRNRAEKQAPGENLDSWGSRLNGNTIDMFDQALDGVLSLTVSGSVTLSTANGSSDQARYRCLNITGTGGTVTIPNIEKCYLVRNASSGTVTFTTGSGTSAAVLAGTGAWVFSTGSNAVYALATTDFGTTTVTAGGLLARSTGGVGYTTGTGGTVTQTTSKSTAVTLNTMCGQITMHNAALAANTYVSFTLNNSTCGQHDCLLVWTKDSITGPYQTWVEMRPFNGIPTIFLRNPTGGSLSDAVVLGFMVIKGTIT